MMTRKAMQMPWKDIKRRGKNRMKHRYVQLLAHEDMTTAATKVVNINLVDSITRLSIQVKATNSDSLPIAHPAKMVTKIELIDGSDVLYSLSGIESQAVSWYHNKVMPWNSLRYVNDVQCVATFHLDFGRDLFDEEIALDPNKFKNLQLKISHDDGLGGCASDAATLSVFAQVFDNPISPRGFFMHKEIWTDTVTTASSHKYIDIPTDYPIRKLFMASLYDDEQPWEVINKIRLSEDDDKKIVINDMRGSDWLKINNRQDWIVEEAMFLGATGADEFWITSTYNISLAASYGTGGHSLDYQDAWSYGGVVHWTAEGTDTAQFIVRGLCPHGAIEIPFGKQGDPTDWYDVHMNKNVMLDITCGSTANTSATLQVFLQQLRTY